MLRTYLQNSSPSIIFLQSRGVQKHIKYQKTRLPPKIKRRQAPNEHKNAAGVFHSGRRLNANISKHFDRYIDVINKSAYHPPFLVHDYIMDTADYILEPFNAGKGVVMNRGHVLNSLDFNGIDHFKGLVHKYLNEPAASSVTFLKAKGNVWSTGTNFIEIFENKDTEEGRKKIFKYFRTLYKTIHHTHNGQSNLCPFVNGLVMGSAASFVANCLSSTSPKADLCWPETSFGFHPDAGAVHILNTLPCGIGEWMALTGSRLTGHSIVRAGIADYGLSEDLIQSMQIFLDEHKNVGPHEGLKILDMMSGCGEEPFELLPHLDIMEKCFVKDTMPEIMDTLEHEAKRNNWAKLQLEKLKKKSPLSLVMTLEALRRSEGKSINFVLRQDFRLTSKFIDTKDFSEGVQKLIIDKDRNKQPDWEYKTVYDIPRSLVDDFFAPTGNEDTEFIIDGYNDKENLEHKYREIRDLIDAINHSAKKPIRNSRKLRKLPGKEHNIHEIYSIHHPNIPIDDVLSDGGYSYPGVVERAEGIVNSNRIDKRVYTGPEIFKKYKGLEAGDFLNSLENLCALTSFKNEFPVTKTLEWRTSKDMYDAFHTLRNRYDVLQFSYPQEDSIIRNKKASTQEFKPEDDSTKSLRNVPKVFHDSILKEGSLYENNEDPSTIKMNKMITREGLKYPTKLEEISKIDFDDYTPTVENVDKDSLIDKETQHTLVGSKNYVDPEKAAWDSDY